MQAVQVCVLCNACEYAAVHVYVVYVCAVLCMCGVGCVMGVCVFSVDMYV